MPTITYAQWTDERPLRECVTRGDLGRLTNAQRAKLAQSLRARPQTIELVHEPFDLPPGYVLALYADGFTLGISPTGEGSS